MLHTQSTAAAACRRRSNANRLRVATFALATAFSLFAMLAAAGTSSAAAVCPQYKFVGSAGSGERSGDAKTTYRGVGHILHELYTSITAGNGVPESALPLVDVKYPAVGVDPSNGDAWERIGNGLNLADAWGAGVPVASKFWDSAFDGADKLIRYVHSTRTGSCRNKTKLILAGYSQGAVVVHLAWQALSSDDRKAVAQLVVFGDPLFSDDPAHAYGGYDATRSGSAFSAAMHDVVLKMFGWKGSDPVLSFCNGGDLVCQLNQRVFGYLGGPWVSNPIGVSTANHGFEQYRDQNLISTARAFLTNRLRLKLLAASPVVVNDRGGATDIVFVVDTTGSMSDEIDSARDSVTSIAAKLAATSPDFRVALVEYRDEDDYFQSYVDLPFTNDLNALRNSLDYLEADGGGDYEESMYSGIDTALRLGFRPGAKKSVIVLGDAPPKDPEPITSFTAASIANTAFALGPAKIFAVLAQGDPSEFENIAGLVSRTGGTMYDLNSPFALSTSSLARSNVNAPTRSSGPTTRALDSSVEDALVNAVAAGAAAPLVTVSAPSVTAQGVAAPFTSTVSSGEDPSRIDWDMDGDGVFELANAGRSVSVPLSVLGPASIVVKYTLADGVVAFGRAVSSVVPQAKRREVRGLVGRASRISARSNRKFRTIKLRYTRKSLAQPLPMIKLVNRRGRVIAGTTVISTAKRSKISLRVSREKAGRGELRIVAEAWVASADAELLHQKTVLKRLRLR